MEKHFNGYNPRNKRQELGVLRKKNKGYQNQNFESNGGNSKTVNYWGKFRKTAVRSDPCILQPYNKNHEVGNKLRNKGFVKGKSFLSTVHQVFDEMPERVKMGNKGLNYVDFGTKDGVNGGVIKRVDTNVGFKAKMGVEKKVINIGEERKKLLNWFREECELLKKRKVVPPRIDQMAYNMLKESGELFMIEKKLGPIPGVEVEDWFVFRLELMIMGIHDHHVRGIDYMESLSGRVLATSIVATEGYGDCMKADELIYTGEGGGSFDPNSKGFKDQELKGGNLALKNSINEGNYVRVVRGVKSKDNYMKASGTFFVYDGLYKVVDYGKKIGLNGKMQFEFTLKRCPGQKTIAWANYK